MSSENCSICNMDNNIIPCNHNFHINCFEQWKKNHNICQYCKYVLVQDKIPTVLFDEIIAPDGNIDNLNEHNYHNFYYLEDNIFDISVVLNNIKEIKLAKQIKSSLILYSDYNIYGIREVTSNYGKLIKICQIDYRGNFACHFETPTGVEIYHSGLHNFQLKN